MGIYLSIQTRDSVNVVLASRSPIRRKLLEAVDVFPAIAPASIDESDLLRRIERETPSEKVAILACAKAEAALSALRPVEIPTVIVAADQLLVIDGRCLEAPGDRRRTAERLKQLSGRDHQLVTGAAVVRTAPRESQPKWYDVPSVETTIRFRRYDNQEIEAYLDMAAPSVYQTTGGYELEGLGGRLLAAIDGDWFAALGLPLIGVLDALRRAEALPSTWVAAAEARR